MKVTKKWIVGLLSTTKTATIGFHGLMTVDKVDKARDGIRENVKKQIEQWNIDNPEHPAQLTEKDNKLSAGNGFVMLPPYPRTGPVNVRSAEFSIDGVYCKIVDIVTDSFIQGPDACCFKMKSGSIIQIKSGI